MSIRFSCELTDPDTEALLSFLDLFWCVRYTVFSTAGHAGI